MRMGLRLVVLLALTIVLVAVVFAYFQVKDEKLRLREDLKNRTEDLAYTVQDGLEVLLDKGPRKELQARLDRFGSRVAGVAVYNAQGNLLAVSSGLAPLLKNRPSTVDLATELNEAEGDFTQIGPSSVYIYARPLRRGNEVVGAIAIFQDASGIEAHSGHLWLDTLFRLLVEMLLITFVAFLVVRWSILGPIAKTAQWMRDLRKGGTLHSHHHLPQEELLKPITQEVAHFARTLTSARAAAEREARLRQSAVALWTPERLRIHVKTKLQGKPLFVVSNREPYTHTRQGKAIEVLVPASGLVTALEPILRACNGTWIAHGNGDADRETVDGRHRLRVPPDEPQYTLRRVWLSPEEEEGYYFGLANEGLWPLCHIAHTRPIFRAEDWGHYQEVNRKFAQAVLEEINGIERPAVLVQDYHFALLPRLVKEARPDSRVAIFWHIPWPNPEAFRICPWESEVLDGLLGADVVGFHIQAHCMNFLDSVDHALECRIEWERSAVNRSHHLTLVRPFPISVSFDERPAKPSERGSVYLDRAELLKGFGVQASFMGVGVDRVDYTKGILERFRGIERFFEKYPKYQKQFTFVQVGAPSRLHIKRYQDLFSEVSMQADRINQRFQTPEWKPIVLLKKHHSHSEIEPLYKAADVCMVTSLHDGMNLVAKEFAAARDDERGALILSRFTGAVRELHDALLVNPYDVEQLADTIHFALEMDPDEKRARMQRLRRVIKENNVYRWAADLITELAEVRAGEALDSAVR